MGDQWFFARGGQRFGPYPQAQLRQMAAVGQIAANDLAWTEGMVDWSPAANVPGLFGSPAGHLGAAVMAPQYAPAGMLNYHTPTVSVYAGFWNRFCAAFIDNILVQIISFVAGFMVGAAFAVLGGEDVAIAEALGWVIGLTVGWLYYALQESSSAGATLGKRAVGIRVVDLEGNNISFGRASGRYFGKLISGIILAIGYIMAAFTERKQALHDMMAGTLVIKG